MAGATISALAYLTKTVYEEPQNQIDTQTVLLSLLKKARSKENLTGNLVQFPVRTAFAESTGYQPEGGTLPTPGVRSGTLAQLYSFYQYGTVQLSGPVAEQIRAGEGAYVSVMTDELDGMMENLGLERNRVGFNDGSGAMVQVLSTAGSGPYTITLTSTSNPYLIRPNMTLMAYSQRTGGTQRTGTMTVQAVDPSTGIITVNQLATGIVANDWLFNGNSSFNNSSGTSYLEPMGLLGIVDDGTYVTTLQGISRSTYPIWKAQRWGTVGGSAAFSTALLRQAFSRNSAMGGKVDYLISTPGVRDAYVAFIEPDRRYTDTLEIDGGFDAVAYTNSGRKVLWVVDKDAPRGVIFGVELAQLEQFEWRKLDWDDKSGDIWKQGLAPSGGAYIDGYWAMAKGYYNLGTRRSNSHFRVDGVQEVE